MTGRITTALKRRTPALVKVLSARFGARSLLLSALGLAAAVSVLVALGALLPPVAGWVITSALLAFALYGIWLFGGLEIVGYALWARGLVLANMSRVAGAKRCFGLALKLLKDRDVVYEELARLSESPGAMRRLAARIESGERELSARSARIVARCLRGSGDLERALTYYELADRLGPADAVKLELAETAVMIGLPERCLQAVDGMSRPDENGHGLYLRACALRATGRLEEALIAANGATARRPCALDYQLEKGRILEASGRRRAAKRQYTKALLVHAGSPDALFRRGSLSLDEGDVNAAVRDLERCCYLDNTRTDALLLVERITRGSDMFSRETHPVEVPSWLRVPEEDFDLAKGQVATIEVILQPESAVPVCRVIALEPFGAGLEVIPRETTVEQLRPGEPTVLKFDVRAKRASAVNLDRPWILNFALLAGSHWASHTARFRVRDPDEGRVFLVISEDHEPSTGIDPARVGKRYLDADRVEADLMEKSRAANAVAEKYGLKWTHMLDAGGAVSLARWAGGHSQVWQRLSLDVEEYYRSAYARGHGCELHLHLSGVPGSGLFRFGLDGETDRLSFEGRARSESRVGSWANVTPAYGRRGGLRSRLGSLLHAKQTLASIFTERFPGYRPILFRAGEWDLGRTTAEREKSLMALREAGILADSSVSEGYDCYRKPFSFGARLSDAAYWTFRNNPEEKARALVDAGILEVVPIVVPQGRHPVTPTSHPRSVTAAYRALSDTGRVKPGRHIIMEIDHLANMPGPDRDPASGSSPRNGAWKRMERHFATVRRECPAIEGTTAAEAIRAWLDYYSPEPVVELGAAGDGRIVDDPRKLVFPLRFLGDGILTDEERRYTLAVPVPQISRGRVQRLRVMRRGTTVFEASESHRDWHRIAFDLSSGNEHQFSLEVEIEEPVLVSGEE